MDTDGKRTFDVGHRLTRLANVWLLLAPVGLQMHEMPYLVKRKTAIRCEEFKSAYISAGQDNVVRAAGNILGVHTGTMR